MSKITKQDLQHQINRLYAADSTRHNKILRIQRALSSLGVDIMSDDFDKLSEPKLKVLDQSVFDGLDEKWRFAAVVEDGRALYFDKRPYDSDDITGHFVFKGDYEASFCGTGYDASNWQNSLIERERKELTGSDLCRAMLARGDKFVMCFFSDDSDRIAALGAAEGVCLDWCAEFRTYKTEWKYAVPINNQGEPLTAKEVGL